MDSLVSEVRAIGCTVETNSAGQTVATCPCGHRFQIALQGKPEWHALDGPTPHCVHRHEVFAATEAAEQAYACADWKLNDPPRAEQPREERPPKPEEQPTETQTDAEAKANPLTLPEAFWSRPSHQHIRKAAWSRGRSADVVMYGILARLAATASHELRFDAGLGESTLNLFVALVGASGTGKSAGHDVAAEVIGVPKYLQEPGSFPDGLGVGTGEGLAELFMGWDKRECADSGGKMKSEKVRAQVRHNALVYIDEGQTLTQMIGRTGATIGPVLRSAFTGATLGQANAQIETTRHIPARSYSLGLVIGYQYATAQPLLADSAGGTPQRFLWASVIDPNLPDKQPEWPGTLASNLERTDTYFGAPVIGTVKFAPEIRQELWQANAAKVRGEAQDANELDSHGSLVRCKVAALLAILDGRLMVTSEDWGLARIVWDTSCAVRESLVGYGKEQARIKAEASHATAAVREQRVMEGREEYEEKAVERVAHLLAKYVSLCPEGQYATEGALKKALSGRDRKWFKDALTMARERNWIDTQTFGFDTGGNIRSGYVRGSSKPS